MIRAGYGKGFYFATECEYSVKNHIGGAGGAILLAKVNVGGVAHHTAIDAGLNGTVGTH